MPKARGGFSTIRDGMVVTISSCRAEDPGSIPNHGALATKKAATRGPMGSEPPLGGGFALSAVNARVRELGAAIHPCLWLYCCMLGFRLYLWLFGLTLGNNWLWEGAVWVHGWQGSVLDA